MTESTDLNFPDETTYGSLLSKCVCWPKMYTILPRIIAPAIINFEGNFARNILSIFENINILENQIVLVDL